MPRSFGTVSDEGSKDAVRYSISGSELEVIATSFGEMMLVGVVGSDP